LRAGDGIPVPSLKFHHAGVKATSEYNWDISTLTLACRLLFSQAEMTMMETARRGLVLMGVLLSLGAVSCSHSVIDMNGEDPQVETGDGTGDGWGGTERYEVPREFTLTSESAGAVRLMWGDLGDAEWVIVYYGSTTDLTGTDAHEGLSGEVWAYASDFFIEVTGLEPNREYWFAIQVSGSEKAASEMSEPRNVVVAEDTASI
jgi:hypothetical protein